MSVRILHGDCREVLATLPDCSVQCCVTSPPYFGLRDYGCDGQIGLEQTPDEYVAQMARVFREVRRVLRDDGTLWLNIGDSYARTGGTDRNVSYTAKVGSTPNTLEQMRDRTRDASAIGLKHKDLIGIPWMLAFALRADGWYLRMDIIWHKPNAMPESVRDRCTKAHEYVFLLTKSARYFYDAEAIAEKAIKGNAGSEFHVGKSGIHQLSRSSHKERIDQYKRNARSVWTIATQPFSDSHFATMAPDLAERCIKAGSKPGDMILDPFGGAGTTGLVADRLQRSATLIELNPEYIEIARRRIYSDAGMFGEAAAE